MPAPISLDIGKRFARLVDSGGVGTVASAPSPDFPPLQGSPLRPGIAQARALRVQRQRHTMAVS